MLKRSGGPTSHWTSTALHGCGNCRGNTLQKVRTGTRQGGRRGLGPLPRPEGWLGRTSSLKEVVEMEEEMMEMMVGTLGKGIGTGTTLGKEIGAGGAVTPGPAATKSAHRGSQSAVPATKSALRGSPSAAPATKSALRGSPSAAPATKSALRGSPITAPATKSANEPHVQKSRFTAPVRNLS